MRREIKYEFFLWSKYTGKISIFSDSKWSKTVRAEFKEMARSKDGPPHKSAILNFGIFNYFFLLIIFKPPGM